MAETRTVHFSLGENAGALLAQIAQEHLVYNHNPSKAIETLSKSLIGAPADIVLKILKGDLVLLVEDGEDGHQQFIATEYDETIHSRIFRQLNPAETAVRKAKEIRKAGVSLRAALKRVNSERRYRSNVLVNFPFEDVITLLNGDESAVLRDIMENEEVSNLEQLVYVVKSFLESSAKEIDTIHFMKKTWPEDFKGEHKEEISEARAWAKDVLQEFQTMMRTDFSLIAAKGNEELDAFIKAARDIDEALEDGIHPVDIMDNYSAGWLSPEGDFYGLNGEIANMLHNQIADALLETGVIPNTEENNGNPDNWLQAQGWVRIHGKNIQYEAHMNERINRGENKLMTDKQIDMITEYCRLHHRGIVKVMFQDLSALTFQAMAKNNPYGFYQKYLNW